jgi:hypothetical protein
MSQTYPTARRVFHFAWRSVCRVVRDARQIVLIAFAIVVLVALCKLPLTSDGLGGKALRILLDGLSTVLLVPFQIGVYRLIIFGEKPSQYIAYYCERFLPYLKWAMVFWLPTVVAEFTPEVSLFSVLVSIGFAIIAAVATVRLSVLFPALAAGRVHVTARDAWGDTQGKIGAVIWVMLLSIIPLTGVIFVWIVCIVILGPGNNVGNQSMLQLILRTSCESAVVLVATVIMMANAALLFDAIGDRVKETNYPPIFSV